MKIRADCAQEQLIPLCDKSWLNASEFILTVRHGKLTRRPIVSREVIQSCFVRSGTDLIPIYTQSRLSRGSQNCFRIISPSLSFSSLQAHCNQLGERFIIHIRNANSLLTSRCTYPTLMPPGIPDRRIITVAASLFVALPLGCVIVSATFILEFALANRSTGANYHYRRANYYDIRRSRYSRRGNPVDSRGNHWRFDSPETRQTHLATRGVERTLNATCWPRSSDISSHDTLSVLIGIYRTWNESEQRTRKEHARRPCRESDRASATRLARLSILLTYVWRHPRQTSRSDAARDGPGRLLANLRSPANLLSSESVCIFGIASADRMKYFLHACRCSILPFQRAICNFEISVRSRKIGEKCAEPLAPRRMCERRALYAPRQRTVTWLREWKAEVNYAPLSALRMKSLIAFVIRKFRIIP